MPQDWQAWVGAAQGNWDDKLAAFLAEAHDDDGTLKAGSVTRDRLAAEVAAGISVNVREYYEDADGTDWVPAFNRASTALATAGGGDLIIPGPYDYTFESSTDTGTLIWQWVIASDDTRIRFEKGARIVSSIDGARPVLVYGSAKPDGIENWATNETTDATVYALTGSYVKGIVTMTLATPAEAANFSTGDVVFIRTGQTLTGVGQPDAELNTVVSANATTGVIVLANPTTKPYAPEYYIAGTSGVTSTSVTANAAPFGIANVTDRIVHRVSFENMEIVTTGTAFQALSLWGVMDARISGTIRYQRAGIGSKDSRFVSISGLTLEHTGTDDDEYGIHPSTGCTSWSVTDVDMRSESATSLQMREGVADSRFSNIRISLGSVPAAGTAIALTARAYGIDISNFSINGKWAGAGNAVLIDATCTGGGTISNGTVRGGSVRIDAPNWLGVETLKVVDGDYSLRAAQAGYGHQVTQQVLTGWVLPGQQTISLGDLPRYGVVTSVTCYVATAFNSDGTDQVTVGVDGVPTRYATAIDVSATGVKAVTAGASVGVPNDINRTVKAFYTNGGSEPSAGAALISVTYIVAPRSN